MTGSIVVVGDSLLDRDIIGVAERLSPDAPVPVLDEHSRAARPGGAALAASLASFSLGCTGVVLVTALADDEAGHEIRALLRAVGVEVVSVPLGGSTPEKIRLRAGHQSLLRIDRGGPAGSVAPLPSRALDLMATASVVVASDYGRGVLRRPELRHVLGRRRGPSVWDPHPRGGAPVPGMTLVTPNRAELTAAFPGEATSIRSLVDRITEARRAWAAGAVVATLGAAGAVLVSGDGAPLAIPAVSVTTGDPCGAGDRFASAVAVGLVRGALLPEAVTDAVNVAGRFVAEGGAGALRWGPPPSVPAQADGVAAGRVPVGGPLTGWAPDGFGTDDPTPLTGVGPALQLAAGVRAAGGTVVVAGGCFDLLHAGHVSLLESARRLGDCLIVALNSDASVRRLKGPGRPVVPEADRRAMLEALASVGAVAIFDEDSPVELLRLLRPHIFAKGGDYSARALPEDPVLRSWGGQAVVLPYLSGRSTTALLKVAGSAR